MEPRFSVIIPSYNRANTLSRAIESVNHQSFPAFEIIVVDDGSTDQTRIIIENFPQVIYFFQENNGVSSARNQGAEIATGDWLVFLDSDDELLPEAIQIFSDEVQKNPRVQFLKASQVLIPIEVSKNEGKMGSGYIPGSFCISKKIFQEVGGFDEKLKFAENTELIIRLERRKEYFKKVNKVVLRYFENANGGSKNLQNMLDSIRLILAKHDDYLSEHMKHLYHQNIGVIEMRFGRFELARKHLWTSWVFKPKKVSTLLRLGIAFFPALARKIYTSEIGVK